MPVVAWVAVGSNVGDRLAFCREAVSQLGATEGVSVVGVSSLYETEPVGYADQGPFYNAVVQVEALAPPRALLARCQAIEGHLGRRRTFPNGPRTMDMDLLAYGSQIVRDVDLTLPHPRMAHRPFVLVPLAEIAPEFIHPILFESPKSLLDRLAMPFGVWRRFGPTWAHPATPDG